MPSMSPAFQTRPPASLWAIPTSATPPPADVVAAVVMFGDLAEELQDGTSKMRFSRARLDREDMRLLLGADLDRALGVSVIWDEREEQIVRVLDAGLLEPVAKSPGARNRYAAARMRGAERRTGYAPHTAAA